ncbi:MAG: hypothetical protein J6Y02_09305 [Pseudobutyrivibrio sp.]|nr:hypothetical protein [Pseudobutyrivibrio sp.]
MNQVVVKENSQVPIKKFILCILVLIALAASFFAGTIVEGNNLKRAKIEGPGFKSEEEAMEAFANAYANKDIEGMFACCSIESNITNYDYYEYFDIVHAYYPTYRYSTGNDAASYEIDKHIRMSTLTTTFYNMYLAPSLDEDSELLTGNSIGLDDEDAIDELCEQLRLTDNIDRIKVDKVSSADKYIKDVDSMYDNFEKYYDVYGGEIKPMSAIIKIDGIKWIMFADTIELDGRWYILCPGGMTGSHAGLSYLTGGMIRKSEFNDLN